MKYTSPAIIMVLVLVVGGVLMLRHQLNTDSDIVVRPTDERVGDEWVTVLDEEIVYQRPEILDATYVSATTWPITVEKVMHEYSCAEENTVVDEPFARREERVINDRTYCVSTVSEGAAGSVYRAYEYSAELAGGVVRAYFTVRYPRCENYEAAEHIACTEEQERIDVDGLVDAVISTVSFK